MDEDRLAAALRGATDDVRVPRDLVRHAERLGRARRSRRRSAATALAVSALVLAGGALVVPRIVSGGGGSAPSAAGRADSGSSDAGSSASSAPSAPPTAEPAPQSAQQDAPGAESRAAVGGSATCDPPLVVGGVPAREGHATSARAGEPLEITGSPLCGPVSPGGRYTLVLVPRGSQTPTVLTEVVPADDGSFSTDVTVPSSTSPGPTRLSVVGSAWELRPCPDTAGCTWPDYGADLDVLPPGASPEGRP